jgi:hypothetical protein
VVDRFPVPGAEFVPRHPLTLPVGPGYVAVTRPSELDGWWLGVLWVGDEGGIVRFTDVGPAAGPPPDPPLARLGPALSGALSGLILEEDGRLCIRLAPVAPPEDPARPWRMPALIRAAFKFEPLRVGTMSEADLAETVLAAFRSAVASLSHRR